MNKNQLHLFASKVQMKHGGILQTGKRKSSRPLSIKRPIHLVLKADGAKQLLCQRSPIEHTIKRFSKKFGVRAYGLAIQYDHIHLTIRIPNRLLYRRWIRAITSQISNQIKGLKWLLAPFTRICSWGKDFKNVLIYLGQNSREAEFLLNAHALAGEWRRKLLRDLPQTG